MKSPGQEYEDWAVILLENQYKINDVLKIGETRRLQPVATR